jgi:hypothetical protein
MASSVRRTDRSTARANRGKFEHRIATQPEQRAVQQRRLPGRGCRGADEDQDAHHIKRIEQDRWCEPDVTEHVADLRGEKSPGNGPEKKKIDRDDHNQCRQIKDGVSFHLVLRRRLRVQIQYVSCRGKLQCFDIRTRPASFRRTAAGPRLEPLSDPSAPVDQKHRRGAGNHAGYRDPVEPFAEQDESHQRRHRRHQIEQARHRRGCRAPDQPVQ